MTATRFYNNEWTQPATGAYAQPHWTETHRVIAEVWDFGKYKNLYVVYTVNGIERNSYLTGVDQPEALNFEQRHNVQIPR